MEASVLVAQGAHIAYPGKFLRWLLQGCFQLKVHPTSCLDTSSATMLSCKEARWPFPSSASLSPKVREAQAYPRSSWDGSYLLPKIVFLEQIFPFFGAIFPTFGGSDRERNEVILPHFSGISVREASQAL